MACTLIWLCMNSFLHFVGFSLDSCYMLDHPVDFLQIYFSIMACVHWTPALWGLALMGIRFHTVLERFTLHSISASVLLSPLALRTFLIAARGGQCYLWPCVHWRILALCFSLLVVRWRFHHIVPLIWNLPLGVASWLDVPISSAMLRLVYARCAILDLLIVLLGMVVFIWIMLHSWCKPEISAFRVLSDDMSSRMDCDLIEGQVQDFLVDLAAMYSWKRWSDPFSFPC